MKMLHVRILAESNLYAAQCLEYDICAQGNTPSDALKAFRRTIKGQIALDKVHGKEPLVDFPPAPFSYWLGIKREDFIGVQIGDFLSQRVHVTS